MLLIIFIIALAVSIVTPPGVHAADSCEDFGVSAVVGLGGVYQLNQINSLEVSLNVTEPNEYYLNIFRGIHWRVIETETKLPDSSGRLSFLITDPRAFNPVGQDWLFTKTATYHVTLKRSADANAVCKLGTYKIVSERSCENILIYTERGGQMCYGGAGTQGCLAKDDALKIQVVGVRDGIDYYQDRVDIQVNGTGAPGNKNNIPLDSSGSTQVIEYGSLRAGHYRVVVEKASILNGLDFCTKDFVINDKCTVCQEQAPDPTIPGEGPDEVAFQLCRQLPEGSDAYNNCIECAEGEEGQEGVWTAVGCIKREPESILAELLSIGLTTGGGIALLMILGAGFIFSTSAGDPKRVDQAKELITSAVIGLIFIIFSIAMLEFIGFTVLKIPGFGG